MKKQVGLLVRLWRYIEALDRVGKVSTLLGLVPLLSDLLSLLFHLNLIIPFWLAVPWFIITFGYANLRLYERLARSGIEVQIENCRAYLVEQEWIGPGLQVKPQIQMQIHAQFSISNQDEKPTDVELVILGVDCAWELATKPSDIKVTAFLPRSKGLATETNPFHLEAAEMSRNASVRINILFRVPSQAQTEAFDYLGSLRRIRITLEARPASRPSLVQSFDCDASGIRKTIEDEIITQLQRVGSNRESATMSPPIIQTLKRFWQAGDRESSL